MELTIYTLFKPTRAEIIRTVTDSTARAIADAETIARNEKTERLRKLRLATEAERCEADVRPKCQTAK